jgi:hypothetical protein
VIPSASRDFSGDSPSSQMTGSVILINCRNPSLYTHFGKQASLPSVFCQAHIKVGFP